MDGSRARRLQELLKRLGQAVHGAVVDSDEVQACLKELHRHGWEAVMLLEASVACRRSGEVASERSSSRRTARVRWRTGCWPGTRPPSRR
ncbi:MAG: hypothetical protein D6739_11250 [Nitrospirae bacterium]|nr:MAG: hypothetical protein D6739_11250 [Nitrospirota bacterium]